MFKSFHFNLAILMLLTCVEAYSTTNPLLHCLAKEEEILYRTKKMDARYRLNQTLINELASSDDITLKNHYVDQVCAPTNHSTSIALLKLLLIKESEAYDTSSPKGEAESITYKKGYASEFQKQVPRLFIQFLSWLQSDMATADCLSKSVPEIVPFLDKIKYLEEELSTHDLIGDKKKIEIIFSKLEYSEKIKRICLKQSQKKKSKSRQD